MSKPSRCDICVDPSCDGKQNCDCSACNKKDICYRELRPTICITRICTQRCTHCCFECGPDETDLMLFSVARKVNKFLHANNIRYINISSGEFICHPHWQQVLDVLTEGIEIARLVTNGDWATPEYADSVLEFLKAHPNIYVSVSRDKWHTNKHVDNALKFLEQENISYKLAPEEEVRDSSIVPVGRAELSYTTEFYSLFAKYCSKPDRKYTFLIDEDGEISLCPFGRWQYANIDEYLEGGFSKRFKEFTTAVHSEMIFNCKTCGAIHRKISTRGQTD